MIPHVLTIAGSDPSGGAGIQADLKTFSALGAYGMAAITALTAQNTRGVAGVFEVPAEFVRSQVETVFRDIRVDAVKIGMPGSPQSINALIELLQVYKPPHVIVDPVMKAQSGDDLSSKESIAAMRRIVAMGTIVTPNIPEAEILIDEPFRGDMEHFAKRLMKIGASAVLLKGGHYGGRHSNDLYMDAKQSRVLEADRIKTNNNHGTGCTLAAALAVYLAKGLPAPEASYAAKKYVTEALTHADKLSVGSGHGPVHHFYSLWR
jgi:hydroxymethylpyrimidine/phosphomethylpyrimidine kinase